MLDTGIHPERKVGEPKEERPIVIRWQRRLPASWLGILLEQAPEGALLFQLRTSDGACTCVGNPEWRAELDEREGASCLLSLGAVARPRMFEVVRRRDMKSDTRAADSICSQRSSHRVRLCCVLM